MEKLFSFSSFPRLFKLTLFFSFLLSVGKRVTAHSVASEGLSRPKTTILIKFAPEVIERDERLGS